MKRIRIEVCLEMDGKNPPWDNMSDFENAFGKFLASRGVEAERINYTGDTSKSLYLYLSPIEEPILPKVKQTAPAKILKKLQNYGK